MPKRPSLGHNNRRAHNWLVYNCVDRFLVANVEYFRGVLFDLGCGESPYRDWFLRYVDTYVGVDWSQSLHDIKADIVASLNEPLPVDDAAADTVVSLSVLEHICEPQVMLSEAFRILKPGGRLVLQVPWQWWIHEAPHDYFRYTPFGLSFMLERAGFAEIHVEPQGGFFTMLVLKFNYFSLRLVRGPRPLRLVLNGLFCIAWYLGQRTAPLLDRLDGNWMLETTGYCVIARKPDVAQL